MKQNNIHVQIVNKYVLLVFEHKTLYKAKHFFIFQV